MGYFLAEIRVVAGSDDGDDATWAHYWEEGEDIDCRKIEAFLLDMLDLDIDPNRTNPEKHQHEESGPMLTDIWIPDLGMTRLHKEAEDDDDKRTCNEEKEWIEEPYWDVVEGLELESVTDLPGLVKGVGDGDDREDNGEGIVGFPPFFATEEGILEGDEEVGWVADVEADWEELEEHIDVVVGLTKILIFGQDVKIEGEEVEDIFDVEERLILVDAVGHEDDVEVGGGFQQGDISYQYSGVFSALFLQVVQVGDCQRY